MKKKSEEKHGCVFSNETVELTHPMPLMDGKLEIYRENHLFEMTSLSMTSAKL